MNEHNDPQTPNARQAQSTLASLFCHPFTFLRLARFLKRIFCLSYCTHFTLDPFPHLKSPSSDAACRADSRSCTEEEQKDRGAENADLDDNDGGGEEEGEGVDFVALPRPPSRDASILHLILHAHTVKQSFFFCLLGWAALGRGDSLRLRRNRTCLSIFLATRNSLDLLHRGSFCV